MARNENAVTSDEPKPNYRGWKSMPFGMKLLRRWELLAGTSSNLLIYFITVFNMKSITATTLVNVFNGIASVATLLGAFLTDTYFGRYKTLGYASVSSYLGMLLLTLTATISNLHPPL
ncbi:hypothetical protein JRO89_XS13G0178600 [Xanthoceras sorbifolium]|uniref:Nitrate transporter n=1 Tax=Xanthoceras sorbifolium TaxID=99658 RepID=A0ABQ8H8X7_9ROSI|nr:hypothetical protein JRO89_XS13G0178600 [Xanthoceras sorbifolium]